MLIQLANVQHLTMGSVVTMCVTEIRVFIQARMSSSRLPGKTLAVLAGQPIIDHVIGRVCEVVEPSQVVLATSNHVSDDILVQHVSRRHGIEVFRGALENLVRRYQDCVSRFPCEWFVRICADSPFIDPDLIALMLRAAGDGDHLVSNVVERSFPPGQSVEVIRTEAFQALSSNLLDSYEREHVTSHFYRHPDRYRIRSVTAGGASFGERRLVVDTPDDLRAAELMIRESPDLLRGYAAAAVVAARTS